MKPIHFFFVVAALLPLFGCGPANEYAGHYTGKATIKPTERGTPTPTGIADVKLDVEANGDYKLTIVGEGGAVSTESGKVRGCFLMPKGESWMSDVKSLEAIPGGPGYKLRSADEEFQASVVPK
jgi:hypothetical protein